MTVLLSIAAWVITGLWIFFGVLGAWLFYCWFRVRDYFNGKT